MAAKLNNLIVTLVIFYQIITIDSRSTSINQEVVNDYEEEQDNKQAKMAQKISKWAGDNPHVAAHIVKMSKNVTDEQMAKMPGSRSFLEIIKSALNKRSQFVSSHSNETLFDLFQEAKKNSNHSMDFLNANVAMAYMQLPGIKDLVKDAMSTEVHGAPFGFTLMNLFRHLGKDFTMKQLDDPVTAAELFANVTLEVKPFLDIEMDKIKKQMVLAFKSFKDSDQVHAINSFANGISQMVQDYFKNATLNYIKKNQ